ncbi:MAG: hypothetical protein KGS72_00970 [Cyanobacteria bacterium REEB67]|nr:hypothetical protein [Cyanobacteria bacterium REEB67]
MRRSAGLLISVVCSFCMFFCTSCQAAYKPPGQPLPDGFSIACYPNSTCTKTDSTPLGNNQTQQIVVLLTKDDVYRVMPWYKTELTMKGYLIMSDNDIARTITLEAQNDTTHVTITMSPIGDTDTVISISVRPKAKA